MSFLARIWNKRAERIESAAERYRRFVTEGADAEINNVGLGPDVDEVEKTGQVIGKSLENYTAEVQLLIEMRKAKAVIDKEGPLRERQANLAADFEQKKSRFAEVQKVFRAEEEEYFKRAREINDQLSDCESAKVHLRKLNAPRFQERLDELSRRALELEKRRRSLTESLPISRSNLESCRANLRQANAALGGQNEAKRLSTVIQHKEAKLAEDEEAMAQIGAELAEINKQRNDFHVHGMLQVD